MRTVQDRLLEWLKSHDGESLGAFVEEQEVDLDEAQAAMRSLVRRGLVEADGALGEDEAAYLHLAA